MNRAETLQQLAQLCRNGRHARAPRAIEPTGAPALDQALPGGGWQAGTIVELMPAASGIGELRLLMPALARITQAGRHVALIAPPYVPYAPALIRHGVRLSRLLVIDARQNADILWACEQILRCQSFGATLAWPVTIADREVRRLQLAAEAGNGIGFVYRPAASARLASPAAVRLGLQVQASGDLCIEVIKCRGSRSGQRLTLARTRPDTHVPEPPVESLTGPLGELQAERETSGPTLSPHEISDPAPLHETSEPTPRPLSRPVSEPMPESMAKLRTEPAGIESPIAPSLSKIQAA